MNSKQVGGFGERIAEKYLQEKGYRILDRNYAPRFVSGPLRAEIDIIAKKNEIIIFVEVKTIQLGGGRASAKFAIAPEEKVNFQKQRKILKAAESWLMEKKISFDTKWQVDIIAVEIDSQAQKDKIQHFENVVSY